jgi:two-component system chemotaxis response regulator CheY
MRVLIIEDIVTYQRFLERVFNGKAECDFANNGDEGMATFLKAHKEGNPYDLIFLDVMMPGMNGFEILENIRKVEGDQKKTKIIMTTSLADTNSVTKAMQLGCDSYLIKPFRIDDVKANLKKLKILE